MYVDSMQWAEDLHKEVCEYWDKHFRQSGQKLGFQVFFSPVTRSPILILGKNPGGNDPEVFEKTKQRCEQQDFEPPTKHDYLNNPPDIGKKTVRVLSEDVVENSVKTNINFFRSKNTDDLQDILKAGDNVTPSDVRKQCDKWWKSFYYNVAPELIVCEGTKTVFDRVTSQLDVEFDKMDSVKDSGNTNYRVFCLAESEEVAVIGYTHPTGAGKTSTVFDRNESTIREHCQSVLEDQVNI